MTSFLFDPVGAGPDLRQTDGGVEAVEDANGTGDVADGAPGQESVERPVYTFVVRLSRLEDGDKQERHIAEEQE